MKHLPAVILLLIPILCSSQKVDFSEVDNYVWSLEVNKDIPIPELTGKLTMPFRSELHKVRAIFFWIASNIEYDNEDKEPELYADYPSARENLNETYKSRKGVCSGYSHLFRYMLRLSGIRSMVITGYARNDLKNIYPKKPNHAWNAVRIEDIWYLFDVTWARDSSKRVNDFWFKTDPELFVLNHYPIYRPYTFTQNQYSFEDFCQFPIYTRMFFDLNFTDEISRTGHFNAHNDTVTIPLKQNKKYLLLPRLYDTWKKEWISSQEGGFVTGTDSFSLYIPAKGDFVLKLGALRRENNSYIIYDKLIYYTIENR